jgi:cyanate permease
MGTIDIAFGLGAALGPAIGGHIYDVTGSYTIAFVIVALVMLGEALVIYTVGKQGRP